MLSKTLLLCGCVWLPLAASTVEPKPAPDPPAAQALRAVTVESQSAYAVKASQRAYAALIAPEPGTWFLLLGGGVALGALRRKRNAG